MNSLTELNGYVNGFSLPYTDERLPNVIFDRITPNNQTQSVDKGFTINASVGIEILDIYNAGLTNPIYTIDVSGLPGATVSYTSLPPGVSIINPLPGFYQITGFQDKVTWDLIKSPTIDFPDNYFGDWTYSSNISYTTFEDGQQTRSWTTAVTVNDVLFFTTSTQFIYEISSVSNINGQPLLGNLDEAYPGVTWSVTITPSQTASINTFTTTGTGGTFSVNSSTKVITITGTRTQVNSRIAGLQINSNSINIDFVLTYFASNSLNATTDTKTQIMISKGLSVLGAVTQPTIYYLEDTAFTVTGAPLITDSGFDGTGNYIYTITPSTNAAISTVFFGGSGGTTSLDPTTKVITIIGTRSQVNNRIANLSINPGVDFANDFDLTYNCLTPRADTATKIQRVAIGSNDTEITNMNLNRNYLANNANLIFSTNTPFISDFDSTNPTYTIIFNCAVGEWTAPSSINPYIEGPLVNPLSITGSKQFINDRISQIKFYPNNGVSANTSFTYTQIKNGVTQVNQTVTLLGTASNYTRSRIIDFTFSQNYTPDYSDVKYGKIDKIMLVGGGGGGGGGIAFGPSAGGGGGGGGVLFSNNDILFSSNTTYNIVIGAGGLGGTSALQNDGTYGTNGTAGTSTSAFGLSIAGGGGGFRASASGRGGISGPQIGGIGDHSGKAGGSGSSTLNVINGYNGGGGGGHPSSINFTTGVGTNGSASTGGRGGSGFDEPGGATSFWGAGGGGGGYIAGSAGTAGVSGKGAAGGSGPGTPAQNGADNKGGGGGGGYGSYSGANGGSGYIKVWIASR